MRKMRTAVKIAFLIPILLTSGCKEKTNKTPTVAVVNPTEGTIIMQGDVVSIRAEADDEDGSITEIRIFIEGEEVASAESSSLVFNWSTAEGEVAAYVLSAYTADNDGESAVDNIKVLLSTPGGLNPDLSYGQVSDIDGNIYNTIQIGGQTWMAENLKSKHYADGTAIPLVSDEAEWNAMSADARAYCWFDNMIDYSDTSGALYTWSAAMNGASGSDQIPSGVQGVCPDGWHLPGDAEWKALEMFLGMSQADADNYDWRGSDEGGQLKETGFSKWEVPNTGGSNSSGFTAVPGGFRGIKGSFFSAGQYATFWTSTSESGTEKAWYRTLYYENEKVYRQYNFMSQGFSVRCVKDE